MGKFKRPKFSEGITSLFQLATYIGQHFAPLRRFCCPLTTNKIKKKSFVTGHPYPLINTTFPFRESTYVDEM